jgi:hypothetical protein
LLETDPVVATTVGRPPPVLHLGVPTTKQPITITASDELEQILRSDSDCIPTSALRRWW